MLIKSSKSYLLTVSEMTLTMISLYNMQKNEHVKIKFNSIELQTSDKNAMPKRLYNYK